MTHERLSHRGTGRSPAFTEGLWESLLGALSGYAFALDETFRVTYLGASFEEITGLAPDDMMGVQVFDADAVDPADPTHDALHLALLNHEPIGGVTYERRMRDGRRLILMDAMEPQFDIAGRFTGYGGLTIVLSEALARGDGQGSLVTALQSRADALEAQLRRRNAQLERSNQTMAEILDAMGEGLLVTQNGNIYDENNLIEFVNPALIRQMALDPAQVTPGMPFRRIPEALIARGDLKPNQTQTMSASLASPGGLTLHLKSIGRVLKVDGAERPNGGYVLVHTDVTEIENRTEMLEKARRAADVANAAKSNFLAAMSHEIRTPMNGIVGMADLLVDAGRETGMDARQAGYIETIRSSALALTDLISDILDFSKIEAGRFDLSPGVFHVRDMLGDVCALMQPMAKAKGLEFSFDCDDMVPRVVFADSARIRQVLLNLLGNAIKFTLSGRVRLAVSGHGLMRFEITDTGIGIPPDKMQTIFRPFEQAQGGLQRQFEGTGLGLAISRKLVRAMGGQIEVHSVEGKGTTFSIVLPVSEARKIRNLGLKALDGPEGKRAETASIEGAYILVAEDNRTNQAVVERMLERLGARSELVADGRAAVEAFLRGGFDLVLMDLSMPRLSGLDAARLIRQLELETDPPKTPIVALTGNAFDQDIKDARAAGMTGFLTKPLRMDRLREELAHQLSGAQEIKD